MNWQPFRGNAPENMAIYSASFPDVSDQWPMKDELPVRSLRLIGR
jgi:hypothetical protein